MRPGLRRLKAFVRHPLTQLISGLVLLVSGIAEIVADFRSAEQSLTLGVHHGVALMGLLQALGSLPELVDGLEQTFDATEHKEVE